MNIKLTGCPTGFVSARIAGTARCYRFYTDQLTWNEAKEKCGKVVRNGLNMGIRNDLVGTGGRGKVFSHKITL